MMIQIAEMAEKWNWPVVNVEHSYPSGILSMKKIALILTFSSCISFASIAGTQATDVIEKSPYLNQEEFTGLVRLGDMLSTTHLDYDLDTPAGTELHLGSCVAVNKTVESNVVSSQYHLLQLMKVNCLAADYYFKAVNVGRVPSFLPATINENFIKNLPAQAIPDLGGQSFKHRHGTLAAVEKNLQVLSIDDEHVELSLAGDLVVTYLVMARGDFNHDGIEDMLLRLDWHVRTAFGKGFDLLMVTQTSGNGMPSLVWRR